MADLLLELSKRPWYRRAVRSLHLPVPVPPVLPRAEGPWTASPLAGLTVEVAAGPDQRPAELVALLVGAGAEVRTGGPTDALVFDATGLRRVADLRALHDFFHPRMKALGPGGRLVVLAPGEADPPEAAATARALDGFVRSAAKELGRKGATAHLIVRPEAAAGHLAPVLTFVLGRRSAFVTGQPWRLSDRLPPGPSPEVQPLAGGVALVTGAARGIGAAIARRLSEEGARVLCVDRPQEATALEDLARRVGGQAVPVDVTAPDALERLGRAVGEAGGLRVLVHNAGVTRDRTLARMSPEEWDTVLAVNLEAVVRITEALLDDGLQAGGRVVCLSSVGGLAGNAGQTNYAASKAGVAGYVRALAPVAAARGVGVAGVAPGFIETRMTQAMPPVTREVARRLSALGQGGLPEDVAEVVTFLASPGAAGLSGEVVRVCGGMFVGA